MKKSLEKRVRDGMNVGDATKEARQEMTANQTGEANVNGDGENERVKKKGRKGWHNVKDMRSLITITIRSFYLFCLRSNKMVSPSISFQSVPALPCLIQLAAPRACPFVK
jgi:hypothetical protein